MGDSQKPWLRLFFNFDSPTYVCERQLRTYIEEERGHPIERIIVAQQDDGRCMGYAWVLFKCMEDCYAAKGRVIVTVEGHVARFDT